MTLPVTLIGGYLGSGKTTLVNHILRNAGGLRIAVMVNDFGSLPIDADLIEAQDDDIISIAGGCVCCSYGNDLTQALMELAAIEVPPDHVVLETSGVALPGAIVASVGLLDGYRHDGTLVLADAETIRAQGADTYIGDTIERQLSSADLLVLNKTDLVTEAEVATLTGWLARKAPGAQVVPAEHGRVPREVLLQSFLERAVPVAGSHDHADALFDTFPVSVPQPVDAEQLARGLSQAAFGLARAKGFVRGLDGRMRLVQIVGRRWDISDAAEDVAAGLVVIGRDASGHARAIERLVDAAARGDLRV
jgi:G3E family GTPase